MPSRSRFSLVKVHSTHLPRPLPTLPSTFHIRSKPCTHLSCNSSKIRHCRDQIQTPAVHSALPLHYPDTSSPVLMFPGASISGLNASFLCSLCISINRIATPFPPQYCRCRGAQGRCQLRPKADLDHDVLQVHVLSPLRFPLLSLTCREPNSVTTWHFNTELLNLPIATTGQSVVKHLLTDCGRVIDFRSRN